MITKDNSQDHCLTSCCPLSTPPPQKIKGGDFGVRIEKIQPFQAYKVGIINTSSRKPYMFGLSLFKYDWDIEFSRKPSVGCFYFLSLQLQLQKNCTQKITENDVTLYFIHPKDSPKLYQTFLHALMAALRHKASNCLKQIQSGDQGLRDSYFPWYIRKPTPRKMNECPPKKYHFKKAIHLPNISFQRSNTNRPSKWGWQRKTILWDPRFGLSRLIFRCKQIHIQGVCKTKKQLDIIYNHHFSGME